MLTIVSIIFIALQVLIINRMCNHYDDGLEPSKIKIQGIAAMIFLTYLYTTVITAWGLEWSF